MLTPRLPTTHISYWVVMLSIPTWLPGFSPLSSLVERPWERACRYSSFARFQSEKDLIGVCKLWDEQLLIHLVKKSTPWFPKSPSLVLIRLVLTEIQRFKTSKLTKKCMAASGWPYISSVNFDIFKWLYLAIAYYWVYLQKTWGFCKAWSALYDYVDQ